jgi:teichoic acid ribitol-phosphate primase
MKKMRKIKLIPTILVKSLIRFVYSLFCVLFKVDSYKVTFASYRSEKISGNLYYIWKELEQAYPNYKCNFIFKKFNGTLMGKVSYIFHMLKVSYDLATSKYIIIDDYYFPVYVIKPRKGTEIIQLWHASGALKKFGLSTVGKSFGPSNEYLKHIKVHSNYSKVYVSASEVVPYYAEAFGMPAENIYPLGIPRTDYFFSTAEKESLTERFYDSYPNLVNKKLILYAPTYRGKSHYQDEFHCPIDLALMKKSLGSEYAFLIHLHPYMKANIKIEESNKDFVFSMNGGFNIQELLAMTDVLITDYSTVFFDFSLLCRPIAFFANDLEEYIRERDFYYDFTNLIPGPFFNKTNQLVNWIKEEGFDLNKVADFRDRFFDYKEGRTSERIVKHFIGKTGTD